MTFAAGQKQPIIEIDMSAVLSGLGLSYESFVDLCIMMGCDYCNTIKGVGPKTALTLIRTHKNLENVVKFLSKNPKFKNNVMEKSFFSNNCIQQLFFNKMYFLRSHPNIFAKKSSAPMRQMRLIKYPRPLTLPLPLTLLSQINRWTSLGVQVKRYRLTSPRSLTSYRQQLSRKRLKSLLI